MIKKVIDISKHNGTVDFSKLVGKVDGVIIRIGYRGYSSGNIVVDPKAMENISQANANNIPYGLYFFSQAVNAAEGEEEAMWVLEQLGLVGKQPLYPIYIDTELSNTDADGRADHISVENRTSAVMAFVNCIREHNYMAGIYAGTNWFMSMLDSSKFVNDEEIEIWCADYRGKCYYTIRSVGMWQYTSDGSFDAFGPGVRVDVNECYVDYPTKIQAKGLNRWNLAMKTDTKYQKFMFPMTHLRVTQGENNPYSHAGSLAMDFAGKDSSSEKLYCPCDMIVKRTRANANGEMYLESIRPVAFADGTVDYARLCCIHDSSFNFRVGDVIMQGTHFYDEGGMGSGNPNKFGTHVHIEGGKGKWVNTNQTPNSKGVYVIENQRHLYDMFFLADDTVVLEGGGYTWTRRNKEEVMGTEELRYFSADPVKMTIGPASGGDLKALVNLVEGLGIACEVMDGFIYTGVASIGDQKTILAKVDELGNIPAKEGSYATIIADTTKDPIVETETIIEDDVVIEQPVEKKDGLFKLIIKFIMSLFKKG